MIDHKSNHTTLWDRLCISLARDDFTTLIEQESDWPRLAAILQENRFSGYLYLKLMKSPLKEQVPPDVWQDWKSYYLRQWSKNERLLVEMIRLANALGDRVLFIKGPLLAQELYGRIDARAMSDLDILLRDPSDMDDVNRKLSDLGYQCHSGTFLTPAISHWFTYHFEYWDDDLALETHWSLSRHPSLNLRTAMLWDQHVEQKLNDRIFPTLSLEYSLLAYILSVPVDLMVGKLTLRTFFEMLLLLQRLRPEYEWPDFFDRRRDEDCWLLSQVILACVLSLFDRWEDNPGLTAALEPQYFSQAEGLLFVLRENLGREKSGGWAGQITREWRRKNQAFALYNYPRAASWGWWLFSLPARIVIHQTESKKRWRSWN